MSDEFEALWASLADRAEIVPVAPRIVERPAPLTTRAYLDSVSDWTSTKEVGRSLQRTYNAAYSRMENMRRIGLVEKRIVCSGNKMGNQQKAEWRRRRD